MIHIPGNLRDAKTGGIKMAEGKDVGLTSPTQTHPSTPTYETILKENRKLAEELLNNQSFKKEFHITDRVEKSHGIGRALKGRKGPYGSPSPWGASRLSWVSWPWRPPWRRPVPLAAGRPAGTGSRAGEPGPHLWIVHGAALPSTGQRELLTDSSSSLCSPAQVQQTPRTCLLTAHRSLAWDLGEPGLGEQTPSRDTGRLGGLGCGPGEAAAASVSTSSNQHHRGSRLMMAAELLEFLWPQSPSLDNTQVSLTPYHSCALDLGGPRRGTHTVLCHVWAEPWIPTQAAHQASVSTRASLQCSHPLGQSTHSRGTEAAQAPGLLLQQLGSRACLWHGGDSPWAERKSCASLCTGFRAPNTSYPNKVMPFSLPWGKMWLVSTSKQALKKLKKQNPQKPSHQRQSLHMDTATWKHSLNTTID